MSKPFVYEVRFLPGTEQEYLLQRVAHSGERQSLSYEPNGPKTEIRAKLGHRGNRQKEYYLMFSLPA